MRSFVIVLVLLIAFSSFAAALTSVQQAVAVLKPTNPALYSAEGVVNFEDNGDNTTTVTISISGVAPNSSHGIHVHQYGDLSSSDGTACGSHWYSSQSGPLHGFPEDPTRHAGDMGNVTADENGNINVVLPPNNYLSLMSLESAIGRCVILHAAADNGSQPLGFAGARMAQGVIGIQFVEVNTYDNQASNWNSTYATAEIQGVTDSNIYGRVAFQDLGNGFVQVQARICGLVPESQHGFHVHQFGDLSGANAASNTGSHYNPFGNPHGYPGNPMRHEGDMGNATTGATGTIDFSITLDIMTLMGMDSIVGRMVVLHELPDNGGQPTGNSGNKIAVGVIGTKNSWANVTSFTCPNYVQPMVEQAVAKLTPTNSTLYGAYGTVTFLGSANGTYVHIVASGLAADSSHGIHVHQYGDLSSSDGTACGSHWYTTQSGSLHGFPEDPTRHAGDMGNITADSNGNVDVMLGPNDYLSLMGVESAIGRCVILHALPDNGSQPLGFAGARMAQGVVGIQFVDNNLYNNVADNENIDYAAAEIKGVTDSSIYGRVVLGVENGTVHVQARICGLVPGSQHGFHVHQFGDLTGTDTASNTGSHYNPYGNPHGYPDNPVRHAGDMGNVTADSNGVVDFDITLDMMVVNGSDSIIGRMAVLHQSPDNGGQPTGNSGTKIAVGVIGAVKSTLTVDSITCPPLASSSSMAASGSMAAGSGSMAASGSMPAGSGSNAGSNAESSHLDSNNAVSVSVSVSVLLFVIVAIFQLFF